jgi:hypothetical protein
MDTLFFAFLLRPFVLLLLALLVLAPAVYAVRKWVPEGKLKRFLLYRINDQ